MHANVFLSVNDALSRVFTIIEQNKGCIIGPEVRSFVSNFIFESLVFRSKEWQDRTGLEPDRVGDAEKIANEVFTSVEAILTTQAPGILEMGQPYLLYGVGDAEKIANEASTSVGAIFTTQASGSLEIGQPHFFYGVGDAERIANEVLTSVEAILTTQAPGSPEMGQPHPHLLLIDVVQNIQNGWCKVFPFCR